MRGRLQWRSCRLAVLAVLALGLLACAPGARFKVLCFFFDGVPGGPSRHPKASAEELKPRRPGVPVATPRPTPLPIISTHRPVADKRCKECHSSGGMFMPIEMTQQLCDKCHKEKRLKEGWNHGPINLGTCVPCHRSHESPYPHLLDKAFPEVCLTCHKDDMEHPVKAHQVANVNQCIACHDPHNKDKRREGGVKMAGLGSPGAAAPGVQGGDDQSSASANKDMTLSTVKNTSESTSKNTSENTSTSASKNKGLNANTSTKPNVNTSATKEMELNVILPPPPDAM